MERRQPKGGQKRNVPTTLEPRQPNISLDKPDLSVTMCNATMTNTRRARGPLHHRTLLRRVARTAPGGHGRGRRARPKRAGRAGVENRPGEGAKGMNAELYPRLLAQLAEPAARALALAVLVGAGLALVRTHAASVKFTVWRAVLVGALAMPLLARLAPGLPVIRPRPAWAHAALANIPQTLPSGRDLLNPASEAMAEPNLGSPKRAGQPAIPRQDAGKESETAFGTLVSPPRQPHPLAPANPKRALPLGP